MHVLYMMINTYLFDILSFPDMTEEEIGNRYVHVLFFFFFLKYLPIIAIIFIKLGSRVLPYVYTYYLR